MAALKRHAWHDPIYSVAFFLLHGEWERAKAYMVETFQADEGDLGPASGAKTLRIERAGDQVMVLWFPASFKAKTPFELSTLAHEAFHATTLLFRTNGLRLHDASDEAYAYHLAWVFRECLKRLRG